MIATYKKIVILYSFDLICNDIQVFQLAWIPIVEKFLSKANVALTVHKNRFFRNFFYSDFQEKNRKNIVIKITIKNQISKKKYKISYINYEKIIRFIFSI